MIQVLGMGETDECRVSGRTRIRSMEMVLPSLAEPIRNKAFATLSKFWSKHSQDVKQAEYMWVRPWSWLEVKLCDSWDSVADRVSSSRISFFLLNNTMSLPPIFYHFFASPLPYAPTLALQNFVHGAQLARRRATGKHRDYLLLLQHRPVFTAGRRQLEDEVRDERARLRRMGADFESTQRGGELTYHGPGQLVGYPLLDLGRTAPAMSIRDYICRLQRTIQDHLRDAHGIVHAPSEHTGVFLDDGDGRGAKTKISSIGVQVRHRLTTHGFALNITREPLAWFDTVVACGLADVKAGSIAGRSKTVAEADVSVASEIPGMVDTFGRLMGRDMEKLDLNDSDEVSDAILKLEEEARILEINNPRPSGPLL
ncbi:hypothetical protein DFH11DRAFT_1546618 [Phellopilus nigrolimitatus]|nr:hypothetical protein DFH11DRAFT_1546618 [Phellopilus nigrolimitatus]